MNIINPHSTPGGVQRSETRGGERTEAKASPAEQGGKVLPPAEATEALVTSKVNAGESRDQLADAVAKLNDYIQTVQRDLQFTLDEGSGRSVITVVDRQSNEVIRRIPEDVTLNLAQKLNNEEPLLLFSAQV